MVYFRLVMNTITIPRNLIPSNDDLVIIPRKQYETFLGFSKQLQKKSLEEKDTDEAIKVYKTEQKQGKLKILKSLSNLR